MSMVRVPEELPILPLRNVVVFPYMVVPITVGQPRSLRLVEEVAAGERSLGLVTMTAPNVSEPGPEMLFKVGTFAKVLKVIKSPDKSVRLIVQGVERINIVDWVTEVPFLKAHVEPNPEDLRQLKDPNVEAQRRLLIDLFTRLVNSVNRIPQEVLQAVNQAEDARQMAYLMCSSLQIELKAAQDFLEIEDLSSKLSRLTEMVNRELEVSELGKKIQSQAKLEIDKNQREYLLREQLKAIKKELGENEETQARHEELRKKIETMGMSEEARKEALRELNRLERLNEASAEYGVIQTYLDWMVSLPWDVETEDSLDVKNARQVLNEDHYDLEKIKERLLEFLAVRKLKADRRSENEP
ncbi:MAG: LON peptidase substrate-binding domain-containing protein, partial [Acidobacteria bacterium]|nr:LON peptidase substrate-binding domain-containing protein [Acidobacteriota bacterium]